MPLSDLWTVRLLSCDDASHPLTSFHGQIGGYTMARVALSRPSGDSVPATTGDTVPQSPPARRLGARSRLRDPRLALGVGLIALSVIAATAVVSSADDRVMVWAASHDLAIGTVIGESDLVTVPVRLDAAAAYLDSSSTRAVGQRLSRPVGTGELVPVAAVGAAAANHRLVTIAVEPLHVPPGLGHGDRVDVYVSSRESAIGSGASRLVMANALVDEADDTAESTTGEIAVVLDVPVANAATLVSGGRGGVIDLARVPLGSA